MPPAQHPQAKFDPIPPDLDLHALVEKTSNFQWVQRITAAQIRNIRPEDFENLLNVHVIQRGKPLVIEKWNDRLPKIPFSAEWLEATYNKKQEHVRDIVGQTDIPMTMGHYLRSMKQLTNQWSPTNFREDRRQRLYLKDIDCPTEWHEWLRKVMPPNLFYMNENVDSRGGPRRQVDDMEMYQEAQTAAPAGDLMSSLPEEMRAQNLMCYIGHEGTYTPAHREMCASLGQNIMVDASGSENGEKPGSSIWFMTETKDREVVKEYFLSMLGHDIEIEKHFAQVNAWKKAGFPVYVVEQKVGDFILVPPLAPHQVWNRGTRTMKVAWNRTTVETLAMALHEALPKARLVCRDEQYKNKAIIFYTLKKYYQAMLDAERTSDMGLLGFGQDLMKNSPRIRQLAADFKALFRLFTEIMVDEMFATKEKDVEYIEFDSCVTCSYCRANIFNRFLTCKHCIRDFVNGDQDTYDVCMECYAMGRSCLCVSNLSWCEQWKWSDLVNHYEEWRALIVKNDGYINLDSSPLPLEIERRKSGKKSVAQICQEQMKRRPWKDITKAEPLEPEPSPEPELDDNGEPKKRRKRKRKKGDIYRCHVCNHKDYTYRLAFCSNPGCTEAYCYGALYRAFDMLPQDVMQNEKWQCPKCFNNCNCGYCRTRRVGNGTPYVPKNTFLGHDTRVIADDRSVEILVDFRVHNLSWLKALGDGPRNVSSKRIQRLQQAADSEKAKEADLPSSVQALPDHELAQTLEAAIQQDDSHINQNGINGAYEPGRAPVANMSVGHDESEYPDPSILAHDRIGIGYYEQDDDSPDRILFDPYQAPPADAMVVDDEPEPSEFFKKQLRVAKRKARNEDDNDPDFAAPKSKHRRQEFGRSQEPDPQGVALDNMDPALFADQTMVDAPAEDDPPAEPESAEGASEHRPYSPNRPALRHARRMVSYRDTELGEEEFNEVFVTRAQREVEKSTAFNSTNAAKDPLDLASAAVQAMTGNAASSSQANAPAPSSGEKKKPGRKPGRPPGRPSRGGKRRGRPPNSARASLAAEQEDTEDDEAGGTNIDGQLARQLEGFDEDDKVIEREKSTTTAAPANPPRRRGRPPRSSLPQPATAPAVVDTTGSFMSMAERMRLKGKIIKITGRKSEPGPAMVHPAFEKSSPSATATPARESANTRSAPKPTPSVAPKRRGRPPKSVQDVTERDADDGDFNPNAQEVEVASEASSPSSSPSSEHESDSGSGTRPAAPRGPAPKPAVTQQERATVTTCNVETSASSSGTSASSSVTPAPAPAPTPAPRIPAGPTVVRLLSSDEESGRELYSDSDSKPTEAARPEASSGSGSSSGSDSDEGDIPARVEPARNLATRGRGMALRGRGGRGRGRGQIRRGVS